jgi:hypothetical protein
MIEFWNIANLNSLYPKFLHKYKKKSIGRSAYKKNNNNNITMELMQLFVFSSHWVRKNDFS